MPYAAYRWNSDMITASPVTNAPSAPRSRLTAPSSCSMYCSAFCRASAETAVTSSAPPRLSAMSQRERGVDRPRSRLALGWDRLVQRDAFFGEVLLRARMVGNDRGAAALVLELEVPRFGVNAHEVVLTLDQRLDDVVRELVVHLRVRDQYVPYGDVLRGRFLTRIGLRGNRVLHVQRPVLLHHRFLRVGMIHELQLDARRRAEIGDRRRRQAADPEESIELFVLD